MMVTVDVKLGEPGEEDDDEQESDEEGVHLPSPEQWPERGTMTGGSGGCSKCMWKSGRGATRIGP